MSIRYVTFLLNSKILITRQLNIIRTRYLTHLFVSITSRNVQNFNFSTLTLTLTLTSLDRPLAILALNYTSLGLDICHICLYQNINNLECVQHFISLYIYLRSKYEQFEPIKTGKNLRTAETESKLIISMMLLSEFSRTKNLVEIYRNKYLTKRKKKHQGFVYKKGFTIVSYKLHILRVFMLL